MNPWIEFEKMKNEMDRLARNLSSSRKWHSSPTAFPALNISEDKSNIYIKARIPGVAPAEAEIFIEGDLLTIKGIRQPLNDNIKSFQRNEITYGPFNRAVTLPCRVEAEMITATSCNGILTITLPKEKNSLPKKISVVRG